VHFLGFSWAGRCGEPARSPELPADVASISGACFGVRRELWQRLGGFEDQYFAYHEDVDLSLRCWLAGLSVRYVPGASPSTTTTSPGTRRRCTCSSATGW
jgi:GT2 family glycosyltransferase